MKSCLILLLIAVCSALASAQQDEVIRVNTELVQTAVTVLDKKGNFVEGLLRDQFELSTANRIRSHSSNASPPAVRENASSQTLATQTIRRPQTRRPQRRRGSPVAPSSSSSTTFISHPTA
jgi:hypothetical protein